MKKPIKIISKNDKMRKNTDNQIYVKAQNGDFNYDLRPFGLPKENRPTAKIHRQSLSYPCAQNSDIETIDLRLLWPHENNRLILRENHFPESSRYRVLKNQLANPRLELSK